jgi:hypothetical protein
MLRQDLSALIEKRLASYGAMSIAVASGFMAAPANASTLFTDTSAWAGNSTTTGTVFFNPAAGLFGNTDTAAFELFHVGATASSGSRLVLAGIPSSVGVAISGGQFAKKFAFSSTVSTGNASFAGGPRIEASSNGVHLGNFNPGDIGYVGLADAGNFGWAKIEILSGYQAELLGFAYNTVAGSPIQPADSPEPSSLVLLALGAAGIAAYRRKAGAVAK